MAVPSIPDRSAVQVRLDLLQSIALESTAMAHLINAQAENVLALAEDMPKPTDFDQTADMHMVVLATVQAAHLKELILNDRLRRAAHLPIQ